MTIVMRLMCCIVMVLSGFVVAELPLHITYKSAEYRPSDLTVKELVYKALGSELETQSYSEGFVSVYSKNGGKEQYCVVDLLWPDRYGIQSYRIDLNNRQIAGVVSDYIEEEPVDPTVCGTCPDPELQMVVSWATDFRTKSEPSVKKVKDALGSAGVKFVELIDSQESKSGMLNYLSCPKLVMWARVGHGVSPGSIKLGYKGQNGSITTQDVTTAPFKDLVKGKYFPLNSCFVGGNKNTFGKGLVSSGAIWMCGGDDVSIGAGSSEPTWAKFLVDVCTKEADVIATFDKYMKGAADKWRYQTQGTGPYYPFKAATDVTSLPGQTVSAGSFMVTATRETISFYNLSGPIAIYDITGRQIKTINASQPTFTMNLASDAAGAFRSGVYVAVMKDVTKNTSQRMFSVVR